MIGESGLGITALSMRSMRGVKLLGLCGFATAGRFTVRLGKEWRVGWSGTLCAMRLARFVIWSA